MSANAAFQTLYPTEEKNTFQIKKRNYWLLALFALYGPSVTLIGELRYVEIAVLFLLFLNLKSAVQNQGKWELIFSSLFLLTGFIQLISDLVNDAAIQGTLKRTFTYVLLAILIPSIRNLWKNDQSRLAMIVGGYCLSYVTVIYIGQDASANYEIMPWRLGLGVAATISICLLPLWKKKFLKLTGPLLLVISGVHFLEGGRAVAALTLIASILVSSASMRGSLQPSSFSLSRLAVVAILGAFGIIGIYQSAKWATEKQILPKEIQSKMEVQLSHPYGMLAAGRPDTIAALYAISKRPILGFGSTNVDSEVYGLYRELDALSYSMTGQYFGMLSQGYMKDWQLGTPSHSHLFGAWADAGIFGAFSWMAVLSLAIYVMQRAIIWRHPAQPLLVLVSLLVLWDTLFSPGPHRMDVAIRLTILIYGLAVIQSFDRAIVSHRPKVRLRPDPI